MREDLNPAILASSRSTFYVRGSPVALDLRGTPVPVLALFFKLRRMLADSAAGAPEEIRRRLCHDKIGDRQVFSHFSRARPARVLFSVSAPAHDDNVRVSDEAFHAWPARRLDAAPREAEETNHAEVHGPVSTFST
jgi:hypothetical protein